MRVRVEVAARVKGWSLLEFLTVSMLRSGGRRFDGPMRQTRRSPVAQLRQPAYGARDMAARIATRTELIDAVADGVDRLCLLVSEDVGEGPDDVRSDVELALRLLATREQRSAAI